MRAEQITEAVADHGEGPVWAAWTPSSEPSLRYVDMLAGDVLSLDGTRIHVGAVAAAFRPRIGGGMVVAAEREFVLVSQSGEMSSLGEVFSSSQLRFNEGGTDPDGRFYCGTMAYDETPGAGTMYLLDPSSHAVSELWTGSTISNGLAWNPSGDTVYYIDTPTNRVDAFGYSSDGGIDVESRRTVVTIPSSDGGPDGMCVDAEGGLWVALWGGSAVHRYDAASGSLSEVVEVGPAQVTACTFGGPGLDELFITTSRHGLPAGSDPAAGAVFHVRPGVRGLSAVPFNG